MINILIVFLATLAIISLDTESAVLIAIGAFGIVGLVISLTGSIELGVVTIITSAAYESAVLYREQKEMHKKDI